ncbi:MAG: DUF433 domain-containing protein [Verrucomicrobia bacterium]|nr:MAG: DUF433 domain-containing protein [Verrucomicrobiota bacterium]
MCYGLTVLNWQECPAVESVPGKLSGAWVFKGTRLPISTLFENLAHGATVQQFVEWYPGVREEQVRDVVKFVADHSRYPHEAPVLAAA